MSLLPVVLRDVLEELVERMQSPLPELEVESPIERLAVDVLSRYAEGRALRTQVPMATPWGRYRVDVLLEGGSRGAVALELDGRGYHDACDDEWRDIALLAAGHVREVVRVPGSVVVRTMEDVAWFLAQRVPESFTKRGIANLERLVSAEMRVAHERLEDIPWADITWEHPEHSRVLLKVGRASLASPYLQACAEHCRAAGGIPIARVRQEWVDGIASRRESAWPEICATAASPSDAERPPW